MPSETDNILEFNQYMKSDKMPYIIYADVGLLIKKIDVFAINPENSSTKILESIFLVDILCKLYRLLII